MTPEIPAAKFKPLFNFVPTQQMMPVTISPYRMNEFRGPFDDSDQMLDGDQVDQTYLKADKALRIFSNPTQLTMVSESDVKKVDLVSFESEAFQK